MFIVTGGAGFIGSTFVSKLNSEGHKDILIVDEFDTSSKWTNLAGKNFRDVLNKDEFLAQLLQNKLPDQIDGIIHLGASSSTTEHRMDYLLQTNTRFSQHLANFASDRGVRFIYASSAATYGDGALGYSDDLGILPQLRPLNPYGFSKQLFDLWAVNQGMISSMAGLKFFNVYGPNEYHKGNQASVVFKAVHEVKALGTISLFKSYRSDYLDGEQKRDFIYVKDCCDVMWWLLKNTSVCDIFNLGTGQARSWNDLAKAVFSALGKNPLINYIDMPSELKSHYQYFTEAPMAKLRKAGYSAPFRSLEEGVGDYVGNFLKEKVTFL